MMILEYLAAALLYFSFGGAAASYHDLEGYDVFVFGLFWPFVISISIGYRIAGRLRGQSPLRFKEF